MKRRAKKGKRIREVNPIPEIKVPHVANANRSGLLKQATHAELRQLLRMCGDALLFHRTRIEEGARALNFPLRSGEPQSALFKISGHTRDAESLIAVKGDIEKEMESRSQAQHAN